MAQRSQMYYCYFRFYIDESEIIAGMESFCTEWEHMFAVGYNYKEYKCFVDNVGGFEHWVGDMRGYISPTREIGFIDGAPSDGVLDQTLLMGAERVFTKDIRVLNAYKSETNLMLRKITSFDAGTTHKIEFTCGTDQKIIHPVMYTLDHQQVEIIKQKSIGITDNSDVDSYEVMVDASEKCLIGSQYSLTGGTVTDIDNAFNRSKDDYALIKCTCAFGAWMHLIIDLGASFVNVTTQLLNAWDATGAGETEIFYSDSPLGGWIKFGDTGQTHGDKFYSAIGIPGRYVKVSVRELGPPSGYCKLYTLMCA